MCGSLQRVVDGGKALIEEGGDIVSNAMYCVPKVAKSNATRPVVIDWLLSHKHGALLLHLPPPPLHNSERAAAQRCAAPSAAGGRPGSMNRLRGA